jgi:hypothetical protein
LQLRSGRSLPCRELEHIGETRNDLNIFIHCAFLTKDRLLDESIENFVAANTKINDTAAC